MNRRNLIAALVFSVCLSPTAEAQQPALDIKVQRRLEGTFTTKMPSPNVSSPQPKPLSGISGEQEDEGEVHREAQRNL